MVRPIQYPDTILIERFTQGYQDNEGNWIEGVKETKEYKCRFVPNSKGRIIATADGGNYAFNYQIALPLGANDIKVGDTFKRIGTDLEGTIMQFEAGQLHSLAWV